MDYLLVPPTVPTRLQTIVEITLVEKHKIVKFAKVFSLESFPLYDRRKMCICMYENILKV